MTTSSRRRSVVDGPSIQVICLGSSGGPSEDNATGLLVRSSASNWSSGSVLAVDAGSHLASITRILQQHFPLYAPVSEAQKEAATDGNRDDGGRSVTPEDAVTILSEGPFAGLPFHFASARANALHVVREHVATYAITHPHLDHLAAFAMNTAAFHNTSRPKRLAALPFTVNAIKQHIFNDLIWPNLTDEDNGVGFVTFQRLTEGGNAALGEGDSRGYIEVCNGLSAKGYRVSHGACASRPPINVAIADPARRGSGSQPQEPVYHSCSRTSPAHVQVRASFSAEAASRRASAYTNSQPSTPSAYNQGAVQGQFAQSVSCIVDSSAFFIRAEHTGKEVLIWGDVEPDSLSSIPRNYLVWIEAAAKVIRGDLGGIFIECSYDDSRPDSVLFGHLAPRHVIAELLELAELVQDKRLAAATTAAANGQLLPGHKRKRQSGFGYTMFAGLDDSPNAATAATQGKRRGSSRLQQSYGINQPSSGSLAAGQKHRIDEEQGAESRAMSPSSTTLPPNVHDTPISPTLPSRVLHQAELAGSITPAASPTQVAPSTAAGPLPLKGIKIVIIHVKDSMQDGPPASDIILSELLEHEAELHMQGRGLGCDFVISRPGVSYWF